MQGYECNSCGYTLFMDAGTRKPSWCPSCRATMYPVDLPAPANCAEHVCEECGVKFRTAPETMAPYKCPSCNQTFPSTPDRRLKHKL